MSTAGGGSRSLRDRRVARVIDRDIAPIWHDRFARLILRNLPPGTGQFVLDLHSGPGRLTTELLTRLDDSSRVLAIEPDDTLIELAKTRVRPEWRNRVYFKGGSFEDVFGMGAASYDLTIANLVLGEGTELAPAVGELLRVSKPGGHVLATLALQGSWQEVEDIFAEVLRDAGLTQASRRLERLRSLRPPASLLGDLLREMNCPRDNYVIESERLQMIFPSGREFLFAPVIEHGPLRLWKAIIGDDGSPQELFWRLKEAIDVYYSGHVLSVTVVAGLIHVQIPHSEEYGPSLAARYWSRYPELDRLWGGLAAELTAGRQPVFAFSDEDLDIDIDLDIDFGMDDDEPEPAPEPSPQEPIKPVSEDLDYQPYAYGDEWEEDAEEAGALAGAIARGAAASSAHRPVAEVEDLYGEPEPAAAEPEYEELTEDEPEPEYEELTEDEPEYEELALEPEVEAEPEVAAEAEPEYEELAFEPEVEPEPEVAAEAEPEVAAAEPEQAELAPEPEVAAEPELGGDFDADDEASFADLEGDEDELDEEDELDAGSSIADQIEAELAGMSAAPAEDGGGEEPPVSAAEAEETADEAAAESEEPEVEAASAAEPEAAEPEAEAAETEPEAAEAEAAAADEDEAAEPEAEAAASDEGAEATEPAGADADAEEEASEASEDAEAREGAGDEAVEDEDTEHEAAAPETASDEGEDEGEDEDETSGPKRLRLGGLPLKLGGRPSKPVKFRAPSFTPPVSTPQPKGEPGDDEGEGAEGEGVEARSEGPRARRLPGLPGLPKLPGFKPPPKPVVREEPEDEGADEDEDEDEVLELEDDLIEVEELEELEDEEEDAGAKPRKPPPPPPKSFKPRPLLPIVPPKPKKK